MDFNWGVLGGGGLGIGGFFLLWLRTKATARADSRKEDRAAIDAITGLVDQVESLCYQYYSVDADDAKAKESAQRIRALVQQIGRKTNILSHKYPDHHLTSLMVKFRQAATSQLDDVSRKALLHTDQIFEQISASGRRLVDEFESIFCRDYR